MKKIFVIVFSFILIGGAITSYFLYKRFNVEILDLEKDEEFELLIPTSADFNTVKDSLYKYNLITDTVLFELLADKKAYKSNVKPGRYVLKGDINANTLINKLRSGSQNPIMLTFNNIRYLNELSPKVSHYIEADKESLEYVLTNNEIIESYGFTRETFISMFIPNTYEFFWNTNAKEFVERMNKEYNRFWNKDREAKLKEIDMSKTEVSILASIVQQETNKTDEMPTIAGLYINRLNRGMLLQSDPTVRYALKNHEIKRVLYRHLEYDSPYNTYKYSGLPPGPICMPEISALESVLNYKEHKYLFMCAKADGSGYHAFAKTAREHARNARKYHNFLNRNRIK